MVIHSVCPGNETILGQDHLIHEGLKAPSPALLTRKAAPNYGWLKKHYENTSKTISGLSDPTEIPPIARQV